MRKFIYNLVKEILIQHERLDKESREHVDLFFDNVLKGLVERKKEIKPSFFFSVDIFRYGIYIYCNK